MRIHHLALRSQEPERLARFYEVGLGLARVRERGADSVWLAIEGGVLMIERAGADEPGIPTGSLELLAFRVTADERARVLDRLGAAGVAIEAETEHTSYFRDPDGRRLAVSTHPLKGDASVAPT